MATIRKDPASQVYRIHFRYGGKQFQKSLKTTDQTEAEAAWKRIELTLRELENGRMTLPPEADFWTFVFTDGERVQSATAPTVLTLDQLFSQYVEGIPSGSMEPASIKTHCFHAQHLLRILGGRTPVQSVTVTLMQGYVNKRSKEKYRDRPLSCETIRKEVIRFRAVWNWAKERNLVASEAPTKKLRYGKGDEKLPFQTWEVIERLLARTKMTENERKRQWGNLFLRKLEIANCLEHVHTAEVAPFVYPMFVFVAHTGARRSEMIRSRVEDFDFENKEVVIREKKKDRSVKETRRRVPMTDTLERVMREWLGAEHPGGLAFCHQEVVERSKKRGRTTGHLSGTARPTTASGRATSVQERVVRDFPETLTESEASHHFKRALAGSKWSVVRGFHVFRHSYASNLAAAGKSPDIINKWMGHQTEEMRRRYRHLFPEETRSAIKGVFD